MPSKEASKENWKKAVQANRANAERRKDEWARERLRKKGDLKEASTDELIETDAEASVAKEILTKPEIVEEESDSDSEIDMSEVIANHMLRKIKKNAKKPKKKTTKKTPPHKDSEEEEEDSESEESEDYETTGGKQRGGKKRSEKISVNVYNNTPKNKEKSKEAEKIFLKF